MSDPVSTADKYRCIAREISYRRRAYPRWIAEGKMSQGLADWQLNVMIAIGEDYKRKLAAENPQLRLFA